MIYFLLLDRKERYPSHEDQNLPPRNEIGKTLRPGGTLCGHVIHESTYLSLVVVFHANSLHLYIRQPSARISGNRLKGSSLKHAKNQLCEEIPTKIVPTS